GKWETNGQIVIGDIVLTETSGEVLFKNDLKDGEFGNYLFGKPWDYGVNIVAGYEFVEKFSAQFNLQFGLANLTPDIDGKNGSGSIKNKGYGISVGYRF
ncbi:MAG: outer membrane beta-barrel protein, partial [Sphingobacterium sp.]